VLELLLLLLPMALWVPGCRGFGVVGSRGINKVFGFCLGFGVSVQCCAVAVCFTILWLCAGAHAATITANLGILGTVLLS
jgi:hypothetical protein